jgi:hypothetical protein
MYDLQLLGINYLQAGKFDDAENLLYKARTIAHQVSPGDTIQQDMYLAATKYYRGEVNSAIQLIRNVPDLINPISYNNAIAYAADIYLQANQLDTAYVYAQELINSNKPYNRITGYHTILSSSLINLIPSDSIIKYVLAYRMLIESQFDQNDNQQVLLQKSVYNYDVHERERNKAEAEKQVVQRCFITVLIVVIFLVWGIFYLNYRNKTQLLQLHEAIHNISILREELGHKQQCQNEIVDFGNQADLREQLRKELLLLQQSGCEAADIIHCLVDQPAYKKLQYYIDNEKVIKEHDSIWGEIEDMIYKYSQNFKSRLLLLTSGKLTDDDFHVALLIKCGVTPTQLTKLIGKTKGTVSYKRSVICIKAFDRNLGVKVIDDIIRLI